MFECGSVRVKPSRSWGPADIPFGDLEVEVDWDAWTDPVQQGFDDLNAIERQMRRLEAARAEALIVAYERSLQDLVERFGSKAGGRSGPGARSFLKQTAAELQMTEGAVAHLLDTAVEARETMPATWAVFLDGRAPWKAVDTAVRENLGVPAELLGQYDALAATAVQKTHASRLKDRLRRIRERLLVDSATTRRRLASANRRVDLELLGDGQAAWVVRGDAPEKVAADAALTAAAVAAKGIAGETRSITQLRHDIVMDLILEGLKADAVPDPATKVARRKGVSVELYLTVPVLTLLGHGTAPATIEGYGPIDIERARELAAEAPSFFRVLTDPVTGVRLDLDRTAYRPPADLKRWLRIRDQECRDPGCRRPAHRTDLDHAEEWQHRGPTRDTNLVSLCRSMHLLKSIGLWQEHYRPDGTVTWTTPWGRTLHDPPLEPGDPAPPHLLPAVDQDDDCPF